MTMSVSNPEPRFKRIVIIINPASGADQPILNTINKVFAGMPVEWDVSVMKKLGDGAAAARQAVADGVDLVAAYGGDGTLLDVANGLIGTTMPMAILPGGTGNAMVDELRIPARLDMALKLILGPQAQIRPIDVGKVGEKYFILRVGAGFIQDLSAGVTREHKDRYGVIAYFLVGLRALSQLKSIAFRLTIDGETIDTEGVALIVNNGGALGGNSNVRLARRIDVSDGYFDVYVAPMGLATVLDVARSITAIGDDVLTAVKHWRGQNISIAVRHKDGTQADATSNEEYGLYADGEEQAIAYTPATVTVLPRALHVLVPPETAIDANNPDQTANPTSEQDE